MNRPDPFALATALNNWYATAGRSLPWRHPDTSAWAVLLSEVMSQQTPVARVVPLWTAWLERWPTPADLAAAPTSEVLKMWANLGYPRRALRLRECAQACVDRHGGAVPSDIAELQALPGVGSYTARAVAAFAYGQAVPVVDTNIRRVYRRLAEGTFLQGPARARDLSGVATLLPYVDPDPALKKRAGLQRGPADSPAKSPARSTASSPASTSAEAWREEANLMCSSLMELGALVCTAKNPQCDACPVADHCAWVAAGKPSPTEEELLKSASRVQKFEGTDRQVRGKVMALLRGAEDTEISAQDIDLVWPDKEQLWRAVDSLRDDGLLQIRHGIYSLPD